MANEEQTTTNSLSTKEFNSESGTRVFNIDGVKSSLSTIKGLFESFAGELKKANELIAYDVNQSCDHSVFGAHGATLLSLWEANSSTFDSFNANFESWSQAIAVISAKNANFTNVATDIYNNRKYSDSFLTADASDGSGTVGEKRLHYFEDNAIESTDANGNVIKSYFDEDGNFIVKTYAAAAAGGALLSTQMSYYDEKGNLVVKTMDASGTVTSEVTTSYDELGRIKTVENKTSAGTTITNSTYDDNGRLISTKTVDALGNETASTTYSYDANGNLTKVETKENGTVTYSEEYTYNQDGLVETITTVENGQTTTITNQYDENGNVTSVTTDTGDGNPTTTTYNRSEAEVTKNPDGTTTTETTVTRTNPDGTVTSETTTTTTDANGKITSIETVTKDSEGNTSTVTTNYDGEGKATTTDPTYADSEGNPLTERPDSFNEDGSINDNPSNSDGETTGGETTEGETTGGETTGGDPSDPTGGETTGGETTGGETTEGETTGGETTGGDPSDPTGGETTGGETTGGETTGGEATGGETTGGDPSDPTGGETTGGETTGGETTEGETTIQEGDSEIPVETVTLDSGDRVRLSNNKEYNVYGGTTTVNGDVVEMYADQQGYLYYEDENGQVQPVIETYADGTTGNGYGTKTKFSTRHATVNSLGNTGTGAYDAVYNSTITVGDITIRNSDQIIGSVTYENGSLPSSLTVVNSEGNAYNDINVGNTYTTDGTLLQSYEGNVNQVVNGDTVVTAASMSDFSNYINNNPDTSIVVRIPQGQTVQWDPSNAGGNGFDFNTKNGSVYLKWNPSENGYQIVDEYGNVTNNKVFTLDGFNTNHGKWK